MIYTGKRTLAEAVRFAIVGVSVTALHYGIYLALRTLIPVYIAFTVGYVLSFLLNFYLTSRFTFGTSPTWKRFTGMVGAHGVNYLLQTSLLWLFIRAGVAESLAPMPVYAVAVPVNFLLVRFVFKKA